MLNLEAALATLAKGTQERPRFLVRTIHDGYAIKRSTEWQGMKFVMFDEVQSRAGKALIKRGVKLYAENHYPWNKNQTPP